MSYLRQTAWLPHALPIIVSPSPTADTRTCDPASVTAEALALASNQHIDDVGRALLLMRRELTRRGNEHDTDKLSEIDWFHHEFAGGFKETSWWERHRCIHRHHLGHADGVPEDVNLIDVLEYVADCVVAGMARSGSVSPLVMNDALLRRAFENTVSQLAARVEVRP